MAAMAGILDFRSEKKLAIFIYKSPRYCQLTFESIVLLVQEKKFKTNFQDGAPAGNLGFPI